jgi:uncharacterized protein YwqG
MPKREEPIVPPRGEAWRALLGAKGLTRYVPALEKLVRPAVRLETNAIDGKKLALGQSRLGGEPDLPRSFAWPTFKGEPLAFVAELNLADVAAAAPVDGLPKEGHLWFFYAADQSHWGFDPKDAGSSVVHYAARGPIERRVTPNGVPAEGRFAACSLSFTPYVDLPDPSDERNPIDGRDDAASAAYGEVQWLLTSGGGRTKHKLLGHAQPIQNPMELECAQVTRGIYTGDAKGSQDPRAAEAARHQYEWRLLLQVDTDDTAKMMWGDAGRIYFWIRNEDLRARRFDKTWLIFQCG